LSAAAAGTRGACRAPADSQSDGRPRSGTGAPDQPPAEQTPLSVGEVASSSAAQGDLAHRALRNLPQPRLLERAGLRMRSTR